MSGSEVRLSLAGRDFSLVMRITGYTYALCGEEEDNYLDGTVEMEFHRAGDYRIAQPTVFEGAWFERFADELDELLQSAAGEVTLRDIECCLTLTIGRGDRNAAADWVCKGSIRPMYQAAFSFDDLPLDVDGLRALVARARDLTARYPPRFDGPVD